MRIPLTPMVVFCNSDTYIPFPATTWYTAAEWVFIRDALESRNMPANGAMTLAIGLQAANTPDQPDGAVALASSRTGDGFTFPGAPVDKSATTGGKQLVRGVYLVKNTDVSDTTVRFAWVAGVIDAQQR